MRMFPDQPGLYDLQSLADRLPKSREFKKLRGVIRSLYNFGSSHADLTLAGIQHRVGKKLELGRNPDSDVDLSHALGAAYNWAIILYARGTQTGSDHRGSTNLQDKYNREEKTLHDAVMKLRNDALAHYGIGPRLDKPWSKDAVVLCVDANQNMRIYTPPLRRSYIGEVNLAIERLIPRALEILDKEFDVARESLFDEYERLLPDHPQIKSILSSCHFDAEAFFEGPEHEGIRESMMLDRDQPSEIPFIRRPPSKGYFDTPEEA